MNAETPVGWYKPRLMDNDGHVWVEMEPDKWVSWFDRRCYGVVSGANPRPRSSIESWWGPTRDLPQYHGPGAEL